MKDEEKRQIYDDYGSKGLEAIDQEEEEMNSASVQLETRRKNKRNRKETVINDPEYELALKIARNKWLKRFMMFCFCSTCCCFGFCFFCCCFDYCCGMCRPSQSSTVSNETKDQQDENNNNENNEIN